MEKLNLKLKPVEHVEDGDVTAKAKKIIHRMDGEALFNLFTANIIKLKRRFIR